MIEGALILLFGIIIGAGCYHIKIKYPQKQDSIEEKKPYDKYRTVDGLLSRRAIKG